MDTPARKRMLSAYLQGTLPEDERRRLEAEYAKDDDLFEELIELENDTIDAYARGALPGPQRVAFEKRSVTAGQRGRVAFARALAEVSRPPVRLDQPLIVPSTSARASLGARLLAPPNRPGLAVMAAMLAMGAGFIALVTNGRLREEVQALRDEQAGLRRTGQDLAREVERLGQDLRAQPVPGSGGGAPSDGALPARTASLRLLAGGGRSAAGPQTRFVVPATAPVQLELDLERDEHVRYRGAVQTAEGKPIWSQGSLKSRRTRAGESLVILRLPAGSLPRGDYVVRLTGVTTAGVAEPVDAYSFTIVAARDARE